MTLLTMCNRVLSESGFREYTSIVGNDDPGAKQILAIANAAIRAIVRDYDWPQMTYLTEFVGTDDNEYFPPDGFKKPVFDTLFHSDEYTVRGMATPQQEMFYRYAWLNSGFKQARFTLVYSASVDGTVVIRLSEALPVGSSIYFMYVSKWGVRPATLFDPNKALFTLDDDGTVPPEEVVELGVRWRLRRAKGLDFSAELGEYLSTCRAQVAAYSNKEEIPVGGLTIPCDYISCGTIPDNGFGA